MNYSVIGLGLGLGVALATHPPSTGATFCAAHDRIARQLDLRYGETPRASWPAATGVTVELFASDVTGHWTLVRRQPTGETCLIASGMAGGPALTNPATANPGA